MSLSSFVTLKRVYHFSCSRFLGRSLFALRRPSYSHRTKTNSSPKGPDNLPLLIYQWQEGVEDLERYRLGGYHQTHIGDKYLNGRYEVIHKLGYGSYSTVWLAKDCLEARYVALKILTAATSKECSESKILRVLSSGKADHHGRAYVSSLLDEFIINGPNGFHLCIVTEAAGCSVAQSKEASTTWNFPVNVARAISAQLLLGLDYIHSCGVVHGGRFNWLIFVSMCCRALINARSAFKQHHFQISKS